MRSGIFPGTRPGLLLLDEVKNPPQDRPERVRVEAESGVFEAADQEPEVLPLGYRLKPPRALGTLPQEVTHEVPGLVPGELGSEKTFNGVHREMLIRHVIPPKKVRIY
jgi:hypothetical protein